MTLTEKQMSLLGEVSGFVTESEPSEAISLPITKDQLNAYLDLCAHPAINNPILKLDSVVAFLKVADLYGNEEVTDICRKYLYEQLTPQMAFSEPETFESVLQGLRDSQIGIFEDTTTEASENAPATLKPGLLRELLIWAFPDVPLTHEDALSDDYNGPSIDEAISDFLEQGTLNLLNLSAKSNQSKDCFELQLINIMANNAVNLLDFVFSSNSLKNNLLENIKNGEVNKREFLPNKIIDIQRSFLAQLIHSCIVKPEAHVDVASALLSKLKTSIQGPEFIKNALSWEKTAAPLLQKAASLNHPDLLDLLKEHGAQLKEHEVMKSAVLSNQLNIVKYLLDHDLSPDEDGALTLAIGKGNNDIANLLFDAGASLNGNAYEWRNTPLIEAAAKGNATWVNKLIEAGVSVNDMHQMSYMATGGGIRDSYTYRSTQEVNALSEAFKNAHLDIVQTLYDKQANLSTMVNNRSVIYDAIRTDIDRNSTDFMRFLADKDPEAIYWIDDFERGDLLRIAALGRKNTALQALLEMPKFITNRIKQSSDHSGYYKGVKAYDHYRKSSRGGEINEDILQALQPKYSIKDRFLSLLEE